MKTLESNLNIQKIRQIDCATLYFMNQIVIVEVKLDSIIGKKQGQAIIDTIEEETIDITQIHYISNRVEAYSLKPAEYATLSDQLKKFKSYSVITYDKVGVTNYVFERMFLKQPMTQFKTLLEAVGVAHDHSAISDRAVFVA